ncbi:MAG TPA: hypothetical protein VFS74_09880, partial [Gemmatimonadales bacterium]|nr:hypothetical protein [Gemmatimonadales bacterium]
MTPDRRTAPIGRVVATEQKPSTPHQFYFWAAASAPVGIGAIVRVEAEGHTVHAVVTDGAAYSDLLSAMHEVLASDGDPSAPAAPSARAEIRLYLASVLRHEPPEPLQPVPLASVWLATDADVKVALRMDGYCDGDRATGIPAGVYVAGGLEAPVLLDCDFLL